MIKAKRFNSFEEFNFTAGSYVLLDEGKKDKGVFMTLPCGHNFRPDERWESKDVEDETKITLSPSIFCTPSLPCWHGYLTNGEFKEV